MKFLQQSKREERVTLTEVTDMEGSIWIGGLYVLVVELLKLGGGVDKNSGGKRCLRVKAGVASSCGSILLYAFIILQLIGL